MKREIVIVIAVNNRFKTSPSTRALVLTGKKSTKPRDKTSRYTTNQIFVQTTFQVQHEESSGLFEQSTLFNFKTN